MSLEEVARATSSSVGSVKQKVHRAYEKLREENSSNAAKERAKRGKVVRDGEIDEILRKAAVRVPDIEAALLKRVADSIQPSMRQVRPLPRTWVLAGVLMLICAGVALAGAARAGFYGFERMSLLERALIFLTLGVLACVAGTEFVNEMIPGSRRRISAGGLLGLASVCWLWCLRCCFTITIQSILFRWDWSAW